MNEKHTPTPWYVAGQYSRKTEVSNGDGTVCTCDDGDDNLSHEANAAFIVRACNSHDALVAALERISAYDVPDARAMIDIARNALAAAKVTP